MDKYETWKPNKNRCYYCNSVNKLYKKQYKSEYTWGDWLTCADIFESCSRPKCPNHLDIEENKELHSDNEIIKYISTTSFDGI